MWSHYFAHCFISSLLCWYSKSERVSGIWTMISYTIGQVAWGMPTAYYLVTYLMSKRYEGLHIIFLVLSVLQATLFWLPKIFSKMSANYSNHLISEEGRSLQVTAGIKVGSLKRSADSTEPELETMMTPLWVWEI